MFSFSRGVALFYIVRDDAGWSIELNQATIESSLRLDIAVKAAVHVACRAYRQGYHARVMLKDGQSLLTLWVNGKLPTEKTVPFFLYGRILALYPVAKLAARLRSVMRVYMCRERLVPIPMPTK